MIYTELSSPGPKPLVLNPPRLNPNPVQPSSKPKLIPRLRLTLKSGRQERLKLYLGLDLIDP